MNRLALYGLALALLTIMGLSYYAAGLNSEKQRLKANQTALMNDVAFYKSESGASAAQVQQLRLDYDELKAHYDNVVKTAEDLDIKLKRIERTSSTATKTEYIIQTILRDSVIYNNGKIDSIAAFRWHDTWTEVEGRIKGDSVGLAIQSVDTIVQIVHRVPHRFLFFKWGTKAIKQDVVSKNPHTKIVFTEYIELK